jgi:hypothetical protein
LGAGTSQSAGLPTATEIIWDLKTRYYCSEENQRISIHDVQNPAVREKIDGFAAARGLPRAGDPEEYGNYFRISFGDDYEAQRKYLRVALGDDLISLCVGHRVLAALMASGLNKVVFTTNFDSVLERAVASVAGRDLAAYHLEGSTAALAALNAEEFPLYCKLHGDFRYKSLRNLPEDLKEQDAALGKCLEAAAARFGFIVAGYSGRDQSVMDLLERACASTNAFPQGLYWLSLKGSKPLGAVTSLLELARSKGITAELVEIETFDSVLSRIWRQMPSPDPQLDVQVCRAKKQDVVIPLPSSGTKPPLLRTNAIPVISLPTKCLELRFAKPKEWGDLKTAIKEAGDELAITKSDIVLAWSTRETLTAVFGRELISASEIDIRDRLNNLSENLHFKSMLERVICLALKRGKPLLHRTMRDRSFLIVDGHVEDQSPFAPLTELVGKVHGKVPGLFTTPTEKNPEREVISFAEAVEISLEDRGGHFWILVEPNVWIWPKHGRRDAAQLLDNRRGGRFNQKADQILSAWLRLLLPSESRSANIAILPFSSGSQYENPEIVLNNRTSFCRRLA